MSASVPYALSVGVCVKCCLEYIGLLAVCFHSTTVSKTGTSLPSSVFIFILPIFPFHPHWVYLYCLERQKTPLITI